MFLDRLSTVIKKAGFEDMGYKYSIIKLFHSILVQNMSFRLKRGDIRKLMMTELRACSLHLYSFSCNMQLP